MPDAIRSALIQFTLEDNNIVASLNAMSGAGDNALDVMRNLSIVTSEEYNQSILEAQAATSGFGGALEDSGSKNTSLADRMGILSGGLASIGQSAHMALGWLDRYEISMMTVENAANRLENAQINYNDALKKYSANSDEVKKAANELANAQNTLEKANLRADASLLLIGASALSVVPGLIKFIATGQSATLMLTGETWAANANTISTTANAAARWIQTTATNAAAWATSRLTLANITHTAVMVPATLATWAGAAAMGALGIATTSVAIPLLAIEAPVWAIVLAIGGLILIVQDLYTWLTGGESVIGDFLGWLTNIDFSSVIDTFLNAGKFLLDALLEGMTFGILNTDRLKSIFGVIGKYLPHSNAETGPLADLTGSGAKFIETFGAGAQSKKGYLSSIMGGLLKMPEVALDFISPVREPLIPQISLPALTIPATGNAGAAPISVSVTITGNNISGDETSLKTMATTTASEIEKTLTNILNSQARRAGI